MQKTSKHEDQEQHQHQQSKTCPTCAAEMKNKLFRTGSVQHPGHDLLVCSRCGARKDPEED